MIDYLRDYIISAIIIEIIIAFKQTMRNNFQQSRERFSFETNFTLRIIYYLGKDRGSDQFFKNNFHLLRIPTFHKIFFLF